MIRRPYLACAIQTTSTPDPEESLARAEALVAQAVERGAELIGLPENLPQICETQEEAASQVPVTYPMAESWLREQARRHGVVLYGGVVAPGAGRVRNLLVVVGRDGKVIARYQKRHLFDVAINERNTHRESAAVEPGHEPVVADLGDLGILGLSICYDVRFPEHYRALVDMGADVLAVPAAFLTVTGKDHWHVLLRARAIENTCYVMAPAQGGRHNSRRESYGHALMIDPWGNVLADTGDRNGLAIAEIHPDRLREIRTQLPCLQHRQSSGAMAAEPAFVNLSKPS
ncbi:MAG TPA: carbon-nitrogen hydrolase family protein [Stenomitos sp.]